MSVKTIAGVVGGFGLISYLLKRKWDGMDSDYTTSNCKLNPSYFKNRIIWITGSSTGIGKELAYYIASLNVGAKLVLTARRDQLLNYIKSDITNKYKINNDNVYILPMNLNTNNKDYLIEKYQTILSYFNVKSIDILINNAGFSMRSFLVDFAEQDSIDMIQTNLISPIILTKIVLSDIINDNKISNDSNQKFGHIVQISSVAARFVPATRSTYSATKAGLLGFSYALNDELSEYKNINTTCIVPGAVISDVDIAAKGKYGKGHNKRDHGIQNGMDTKRCAELICIAISNKILESWTAKQPGLSLLYHCYFTTPSKYDGRQTVNGFLKEAAGYLPSKL